MKKFGIAIGFIILVSCVKEIDSSKMIVEQRQPILPVLVGKEQNRILDFRLNVLDSLTSYEVKTVHFNFEGTTDLSDIKNASINYNTESKLAEASNFGNQSNITLKLIIEGDQTLTTGDNFFWLTVGLNGTPDLSNKINVKLEAVEFKDGSVLKVLDTIATRAQRIGIALRQHDQDKVDTYRIPGLVTTNDGSLIAVYDNRYSGSVDLQADVDVAMSRSTDGGQTWSPMKVIMDMGEYGGLPNDQNGIGDPAILVDRTTGTIWVAAVWAHGHPDKRNWWASKQGLKPETTSQFVLVKSEDDGITWSEPINITEQIKDPDWYLLLQGPGKGITLKDGTLVFPAQFKDAEQMPHSTLIYSKDNGETWTIGTGAKSNTTEAQIVELENGSLMLNMRDNRNREAKDGLHGRSVVITKDLGRTWTEHPTSRKVLQESTCMASLISYKHSEKGQILFFSNPNTTKGRGHMSIKTSFDQGNTWPKENQLELYEDNTYGYSCMTIVDKDHIGILYEGNKELFFEKVAINDLIENR